MKNELPIFLFIVGLVLFNWPILTIFSSALPFYLFAAWFGFILFHLYHDLRATDGD